MLVTMNANLDAWGWVIIIASLKISRLTQIGVIAKITSGKQIPLIDVWRLVRPAGTTIPQGTVSPVMKPVIHVPLMTQL